tara:strand:- start:298 stop:2256 length:1959 start_codon:yes stop_codon:yes gene_type:complete
MSAMKKKRFHMLSLPHTITCDWWSTCAFTTKVFKLTEMLTDLGHEVIHYGNEGNEARCSESVTVMSKSKLEETYSLDGWKEVHTFDTSDQFHRDWWDNCSIELNKRLYKGDFVLCPWGIGHRPVLEKCSQDILPHVYIVESGIGYPPSAQFAPYRVFESNTYLAYSYGYRKAADIELDDIPRKTDIVIPNVYDPKDFLFSNEKEDYILFFGRVLKTKGTPVLAELIEARPDLKIKIAGQYKEYIDNIPDSLKNNDNVELIGYVDNDERAELLSKAKCVICPTEYVEAFGGVAVEAQLCGTPVIASAWGAFTETIWHGQTGFICRNAHQYLSAIDKVDYLDNDLIRKWAVENYSLERGKKLYDEYFDMIQNHTGSLTLYDRLYPLPLPKFIPTTPVIPLTIADKDNEDMKYLKETCPQVEILGLNKEFSFLNKIKYVYQRLLNLPSHAIAIITDAHDVFYLDNIKTITEKFLKEKCGILWSTEKYCTHILKEDQPFFDDKASVGDIGRAYRYINTGTFMGRVDYLLKLYKDLMNNISNESFIKDLYKPCWGDKDITDMGNRGYTLTDRYVDQVIINHTLVNNGFEKYNLKLDYNCQVFYIPSVDWDKEGFYTITPEKRIHVTQTNSLPSIIHVPAKTLGRAPLLDYLYYETRQ